MMKPKVLSTAVLGIILIMTLVSCENDLNSEPESPALKLISPAQETEWKAGEDCLIKWENNTSGPVTIELLLDDEIFTNIGTFAHIMTEYSYMVPDSIIPATEYSVKLYLTEKPETSVKSVPFSIKERDNLPPTCEIIDPRDGKYILTGDLVHITIEANDPDGEIVTVKLYIDGVYAGQLPKSSFVFPWETLDVPIGLHEITAAAVDDDGAESIISKVNVVITDGSSPVELLVVPSGQFLMGSSLGDYDEKPVNRVFITHDFYLGKFEITNWQYAEILNYAESEGELAGDYPNNVTVMNLNGTQKELLDLNDAKCEIFFDGTIFKADPGKENRPVIELTWWGAAFYCNMLSRQLNVTELYDLTAWKCDLNGTGFRLPTEAEWEYAAKYNDTRTYPWGSAIPNNTLCNFQTAVGHTTDVGAYSPSGNSQLGFCDMAGNAWEWCNDWYGYYPTGYSFLVDPSGPSDGKDKILRGGNFYSAAYNIRTTYRNCYNLYSGYFYGMRVVLSIR
jgi:formylglycine-generating enzyme required for sulfatase activity